MSWINSGAFQLVKNPNRHYVFRRNNSGNTEINVPRNIITKQQAKAWLRAHPNKVTKPTRYRAKRVLPKFAIVPSIFTVPKGPWKPNVPGVPYSPSNFPLASPRPYLAVSPPWVPPPPSPNSPNKTKWGSVPCDKLKASLKKFKSIGGGRQGKIYLASRSLGGRRPFIIKVCPRDLLAAERKEPQPADIEFRIQKAAGDAAPDGVVRVFDILRCLDFVKPSELDGANFVKPGRYDRSKQGLIFMEYCSGGSVRDWLKKTKQTNDEMGRHLVSQILTTLATLQRTFPYFRHNDLHLDNVFVSSRGFLIGDFGWARLEKNGTNPAVNTANSTGTAAHWGVGPKTDVRYDHHMFLSELLDTLKRQGSGKYPETLAFLERAVPIGYRGVKDLHISEGRLKYGDPCPGLPSLDKLLRDPFLKKARRVTSPMLAAAKGRLRKIRKSPARPKKLIQSPNLVIAKARLRKVAQAKKKGYTNQELLNLPAAQFMKLSPGTKNRLKALRAATKIHKGTSANKGKKANATARAATKVLQLPNLKKRAPIPKNVLKSAKFNRLVEKIWKAQNTKANESFQNAWNRARNKAMNQVQTRLNNGRPAFTPSPPKAPKAPSPPKAPKVRSPRTNLGMKLSPGSGRVKIRAPNSGRLVYANGATISLEYLKNLAGRYSVNIRGLRSKADVARKIFGH